MWRFTCCISATLFTHTAHYLNGLTTTHTCIGENTNMYAHRFARTQRCVNQPRARIFFAIGCLCVCVRWKVVDHYMSRVCGVMQLLQQRDIVGRTSEFARVFGIQFYHVLTRGSQVHAHAHTRGGCGLEHSHKSAIMLKSCPPPLSTVWSQ